MKRITPLVEKDSITSYLLDQAWVQSKLKSHRLKRKVSAQKLRLKKKALNQKCRAIKRRDWMLFTAMLLFLLAGITLIVIHYFYSIDQIQTAYFSIYT
jgi:hypothetical protein